MNRKAQTLMMAAAGLLVISLMGSRPAWAAKKVLRLRLDGPVREAPSEQMNILALMQGQETKTFYEWLQTIDRAAGDSDIAGIALIVEQPEMKLAQVEEFSRALKAFRDKGKKVYCYLDYANNLTYLLACAADHITLAETSPLDIVGLHGEMVFFKGLFDKIGVQADMLHCGAYKSAVEPFTRTEPSPEAAENINWLLDGLFGRWLQMMAAGRGLPVEQMRTAVDQAPLPAEEALRLKLVDEVSSFAAFKQRIRKEFGEDVEIVKKIKKEDELEVDLKNPFAVFELLGKLIQKVDEPAADGIAIIYIEGDIVVGKNEPDIFGSGSSAGSTTIRAAFEKVRDDPHIKAVVVRVDSPGGSALASDIMWKAARRCAEEKPVIVSMGGVAGSGGYYVSIPGDPIYAEESTLTGSIGVLGGKLVWKGLMEQKLGITFAEFGRGKHAGLMSPNRAWTDAERQFMQEYMEHIYEQFKGRVLASRGDRIKGDLEQHAGGRVYTGRQALERGLVDRIGGLSDALEYARRKVGLPRDCKVYAFPEKKQFFDAILAQLTGQEREDEFEISLGPGQPQDPLLRAALPLLREWAPRQLGQIARFLQSVVILEREKVACFMPFMVGPR